jgi:hypothetical protein
MPKFMRPYIERIVDVISDGNCGFRAIAETMGLTEERHVFWINTIVSEHSWRLRTRETNFTKKPTNQDNPILCDTSVKANEEFEDVVEHLDDLISLDEI